MIKFDHLRIPVSDLARSRDWYVRTLNLKVEFEVPDRQTVALQDSNDFTIFLRRGSPAFIQMGARSGSRSLTWTPPLANGRHGVFNSPMAHGNHIGATGPS